MCTSRRSRSEAAGERARAAGSVGSQVTTGWVCGSGDGMGAFQGESASRGALGFFCCTQVMPHPLFFDAPPIRIASTPSAPTHGSFQFSARARAFRWPFVWTDGRLQVVVPSVMDKKAEQTARVPIRVVAKSACRTTFGIHERDQFLVSRLFFLQQADSGPVSSHFQEVVLIFQGGRLISGHDLRPPKSAGLGN